MDTFYGRRKRGERSEKMINSDFYKHEEEKEEEEEDTRDLFVSSSHVF